jgi:hypothetical protein
MSSTTEAFANLDLRADAPEARKASVRFAFEFPELLQVFRQIDESAEAARIRSRRIGFIAIVLVLMALLLASADSLFTDLPARVHHAAGYLAAALGLIGTALALLSLNRSSSQRGWVRQRMQTECLRNFHFLLIAERLPQIVAASGNPELESHYQAERAKAFAALRGRIVDRERETLASIVADREYDPLQGLVEAAPVAKQDDSPVAADVFAAWRKLRLDWQLAYCDAKLADDTPNGRPSPRRLESLFSIFGWTCIGIIILLHVLHFGDGLLGLSQRWLQVGTVWTALIALAARTLESGLAPQREVERYEQYRVKLRVAAQRFQAAQTFAARVEALRTLERVALEEMLTFVRTHARAHFLM